MYLNIYIFTSILTLSVIKDRLNDCVILFKINIS